MNGHSEIRDYTFWIMVAILFVVIMSDVTSSAETCELRTTEMTLQKVKTYNSDGGRIRLACEKVVTLNMCGGTCYSQVTPSLTTYPAFDRKCKCCKETSVQIQRITLDQCYHEDTLIPGQQTSMSIRQPTGCRCRKCTR